MATSYFMNMEKLSLEIAYTHILNMTNDNTIEDLNSQTGEYLFLDQNKLINNLQNGFVVITQLSCYFESFLNTIIINCMNYKGDVLLKSSISEKIDIIFMHYQKDWKSIKSNNYWSCYIRTTKIRNEMIHFKNSYIGDGTGIPRFKLGNIDIDTFFTKNNLLLIYEGFLNLTELIAKDLGLSIRKEINIFTTDGMDNLVNYVYSI